MELLLWDYTPIPFKISRYPDGQVNVNTLMDLKDRMAVIRVRMNSFNVLQDIAAAASSLRKAGAEALVLETPYLLGGRSDRSFGENGTDYLKDVICPFLNHLAFQQVRVMDPHSSVMMKELSRSQRISMRHFYQWVTRQIPFIHGVISPDQGAVERAREFWGYATPQPKLIQCLKKRDLDSGRILETQIPVEDFEGQDLVLVDDICDGGATFLNLGRELRTRNCGNLHLVVTHGIFSAGFHLLADVFDTIFVTDSYKEIEHPLVRQFKLWSENK